MKSKKLIFTAITALLLAFSIGRWTSPNAKEKANAHSHETKSAQAHTTWTCSMHPQIKRPEPGNCPICGMELIPLVEQRSFYEGPSLSMSPTDMIRAEIRTSPVERRFPEKEIRLVGKLDYDETREKSLTARFPARIDKLFVNYTGVSVKRGDHLAEVYSPELFTAQNELISAYSYSPDSAATQAAREKLRLWDLLPEQIDAITQSGKAADHFELKAPVSGVVSQKSIKEGDYLNTGESLFTIVDLTELWLRLEAFESDLPWLRFGQTVTFSVLAYPGEQFEGRIAFIDPEVDPKTRTIGIRVNVPNTDSRLKPGMLAKGLAKARIAQGGNVFTPEFAGKWISPMHPEIVKDGPGKCDVCGMELVPAEELGYVLDENAKPPLVVPASAVLQTGKRAIVYLENPYAGQPTFEGREIVLGPQAGDVFIVESGLSEGDSVVTNGAFKIDSALQIRAKASMMSPAGESEPPAESPDQTKEDPISIDPEIAKQSLPAYFDLQAALANDDLPSAQSALKAIMSTTGHHSPIADQIHQMMDQGSLDEMRKPYFDQISQAYIEAISQHTELFEGKIYRMHCPMVYPDHGADWLQANDQLRNPYFGAMMLTCGETKEVYEP